jgi:3-phosphoshikimate 1-carboxyvinyltransferase
MTASSSKSPSVPAGRLVPAGRRIAGRLRVPPSKSATHRAYNLALLAAQPMVVERPLVAEDTELFEEALRRCGFAVERDEREVRLRPGPTPAQAEIFCGNAGTLLRFLTATLTALPGRFLLDGSPRLRERPIGPLVDALRGLGASIDYAGRTGFAPLRIAGATLRGGRVRLDAGESSQYLSALLMAGCRAPEAIAIEVPVLASAPYVDLTVRALAVFGAGVGRRGAVWMVQPSPLRADRFVVEGDYSAACYPAAAAALSRGRVVLEGLAAESAQGDRRFLALLAEMGARVGFVGQELVVEGGALGAVDCDLGDVPDQVPTLAALAPFARGVTRIRNVRHLRIKESDRLRAMAEGLNRLGAEVTELEDGLVIPGVWAERQPPENAVTVDPHGDHRIAMSLALVGLRRPGVTLASPEVVGKSYPGFWSDLAMLGAS